MYIVQLANELFFKELNSIDLIFTNKVEFAKTYETIGDAMRDAIIVNKQLNSNIAHVTSVS